MEMHDMWCMNWIVHVKREMLQKEPLHLALWFESYAPLKFNVHLAKIDPYLFNHKWEIHDLGLFGNGRTRPTTFMFNKISFEAFLMMQTWGENLSIFGNFKLQVTYYFWKVFIWLYFLHCWCLKCQMKLVWTWMKCL